MRGDRLLVRFYRGRLGRLRRAPGAADERNNNSADRDSLPSDGRVRTYIKRAGTEEGAVTLEEAKTAMLRRHSVSCKGIDYDKITAIIIRPAPPKRTVAERATPMKSWYTVSCELLDKCKHSVTIAPVAEVVSREEAVNAEFEIMEKENDIHD